MDDGIAATPGSPAGLLAGVETSFSVACRADVASGELLCLAWLHGHTGIAGKRASATESPRERLLHPKNLAKEFPYAARRRRIRRVRFEDRNAD